jgi:hypothetical protein
MTGHVADKPVWEPHRPIFALRSFDGSNLNLQIPIIFFHFLVCRKTSHQGPLTDSSHVTPVLLEITIGEF